jgi:uncharacterized protein YprB with RNaseH-like and TPR domain
MASDLRYWTALYLRLRDQALCLDIETDGVRGPITVVGLHRPVSSGAITSEHFVRGIDLTPENLAAAFSGCKAFITYNGVRWDIPRLRAEFGSVVPNAPVIDLFKFSQALGPAFTSLKTWQNTIGTAVGRDKRRGIAQRLWRQWRFGNRAALDHLLQYNRLDVIDLPFLADDFVRTVLSCSSGAWQSSAHTADGVYGRTV